MIRHVTAFLVALALPSDTLAEEAHAAEQLTIETAPVKAKVDLTCNFEIECFETENCVETGFSTQLTGVSGGMAADNMIVDATLQSDAASTPMLGLQSAGSYALSGGTFDARHFLTIAATGGARYGVHLADGPIAITYHGTCEGLN